MIKRFILASCLLLIGASAIDVHAAGTNSNTLRRTTANIKLHDAGSIYATIISVLPAGTEVKLLDTRALEGWLPVRVISSGKEGWVSAQYLTTPAKSTVVRRSGITSSSKRTIKTGKTVLRRTLAKTKLRDEASQYGTVINTLNKGVEVMVLEAKGGWIFVHAVATGEQGWVSTKLLSRTLSTVYRPIVTSLKEMGLKDGIIFEGSEIAHMANLYFPLPKDSIINTGTLYIKYSFSPVLSRLSNLRVDVNGTPRKAIRLPDRSNNLVLKVQLSPRDFTEPTLKVAVRAALFVEENRCLDERVNASFLHVLPDSSLHLSVHESKGSMRSAWRMLPEVVTVSIPPGDMHEDVFAAAWQTIELLLREGKKVKVVKLPELGDVVIANHGELKSSIIAAFPRLMRNIDDYIPSAGFNLKMIGIQGEQFIAFSEPFNITPLYSSSKKWMDLFATEKYISYPVSEKIVNDSNRYEINLDSLGLDTSPRMPSRRAEWRLLLSPQHLPANYQPERVKVSIISAPTTGDNPVMLYIYLNELLQEVIKLPDDGLAHDYDILLSKDSMLPYNALKFAVQREKLEGDCYGSPDGYPVQILPNSSLIVKKETGEPEKFSEIRRYFAGGFKVYLSDNVKRHSESSLMFLAKLTADLGIPIVPDKVKFIRDSDTIQPDSPYLLIGGAGATFKKLPVHFDQGHVKVVDKKQNTLLDVSALPEIAVAQITSVGSYYGLWIKNPSNLKFVASEKLHLSEDDVAFIDYKGVVLTIDSEERSLAQVYYPQYKNWLDFLGKYRLWIMALGWVIVVLIALLLYRVVAGHVDDDDDVEEQPKKKETDSDKDKG